MGVTSTYNEQDFHRYSSHLRRLPLTVQADRRHHKPLAIGRHFIRMLVDQGPTALHQRGKHGQEQNASNHT